MTSPGPDVTAIASGSLQGGAGRPCAVLWGLHGSPGECDPQLKLESQALGTRQESASCLAHGIGMRDRSLPGKVVPKTRGSKSSAAADPAGQGEWTKSAPGKNLRATVSARGRLADQAGGRSSAGSRAGNAESQHADEIPQQPNAGAADEPVAESLCSMLMLQMWLVCMACSRPSCYLGAPRAFKGMLPPTWPILWKHWL